MVELAGSQTGGATVDSYNLRYDDASEGATWTNLIGYSANQTTLSYSVTSSIQIGRTYKFQYRVLNMHGWSEWSPVLDLIAAQAPDQISPAAVTFNEGALVRIQWT